MESLTRILRQPVRIDDVIEMLVSYRPDSDTDLIRRAFVLSSYAHKNQLRKSGEPYLNHPLAVAYLLATWNMDEISIAAGLIHDVLEDAPDLVTLENLQKIVGPDVAHIVEALTKLEKKRFESQQQRQAEFFIRMLMAATTDPRVLYVKLADRVHNMLTLEVMTREKQVRIAQETQSVYVPLALRLGIGQAYSVLSDLCLKYLEPNAFKQIDEFVQAHGALALEVLQQITAKIEKELSTRGIISAELSTRVKRPFSIYKKMKRKNVALEDIMDFIGVRIIVDTVGQCYEVLGIIHELWKHIPGEFDDYITRPKPNRYQSLHTAILYPWGDRLVPVEVQIRTHEMNEIADHGLAAHIIYKGAIPADDPRYAAWVKEIHELRTESSSPDQFFQKFQELMQFEKIHVYTPKGDIVELPNEATPLDFAFSIHTNIGIHCHRARVNGRLVSLGHTLKSGDTVEIITKPQQEPTEEWLHLAHSKRTLQKIRNYLRKKRQKEKELSIQRGEQTVRRLLEKYPGWTPEKLLGVLKKSNIPGLQASLTGDQLQGFYAAVGDGIVTHSRLTELIARAEESESGILKKILKPFTRRPSPVSELVLKNSQDPLTIAFRRASCCNPLPGESVVLYMSQRASRMPTLHRTNCARLAHLDPGRIYQDIVWIPGDQQSFPVPLQFITQDRPKMLADILSIFSAMTINLQHVKADAQGGQGRIVIVPLLKDFSTLEHILQQAMKVKGVFNIQRIGMDEVPVKSPPS